MPSLLRASPLTRCPLERVPASTVGGAYGARPRSATLCPSGKMYGTIAEKHPVEGSHNALTHRAGLRSKRRVLVWQARILRLHRCAPSKVEPRDRASQLKIAFRPCPTLRYSRGDVCSASPGGQRLAEVRSDVVKLGRSLDVSEPMFVGVGQFRAKVTQFGAKVDRFRACVVRLRRFRAGVGRCWPSADSYPHSTDMGTELVDPGRNWWKSAQHRPRLVQI